MSRKLIAALPTLTDGHRRKLRQAAEAHGFTVAFYPDYRAAAAGAADAEIILTNLPEPARYAPHLKWFCTTNAGYDVFLKDGIFASPDAVLSNCVGAYGVTLSEHIVAVTLMMMRRQCEYRDIMARREWTRDLAVRSIHGSRVLILGTGDIGTETARRLRAFGPACITGFNRRGQNPEGLFDRIVGLDALDAVLPETDLLVMCLPGTAETSGLMNAERLALMPGDAFLVNVGRGSALDQAALSEQMKAGRFAGAALDVFRQEPVPADDPLWETPRLLMTPHVAGNVSLPYTVDRIVDLFLEDFENYCAGRPLKRQVDRTVRL